MSCHACLVSLAGISGSVHLSELCFITASNKPYIHNACMQYYKPIVSLGVSLASTSFSPVFPATLLLDPQELLIRRTCHHEEAASSMCSSSCNVRTSNEAHRHDQIWAINRIGIMAHRTQGLLISCCLTLVSTPR